jgi:hypothetical protein
MLNKGFNMIRMDFYWENIETLEGLLAELMQRDIKPYLVLAYGNQIYDDGEFPYSAEAISAFVDFSLAAVGHFQGKGVIWEVISKDALMCLSSSSSFFYFSYGMNRILKRFPSMEQIMLSLQMQSGRL